MAKQEFVFNIDRMTKEVGEAVQDAVIEGEKLVKERIETSGLGVEWKRSHNGRTMSSPGRVDTRQMLDSVESDFKVEGNGAVGRFGWLTTFERYFGLQEGGFFHKQANRKIRGMYAMQDAADQVMETLEQRIDGILRGN